MGNNEQKESGAEIIFNILRDLNSEIQYIPQWATLLRLLRRDGRVIKYSNVSF